MEERRVYLTPFRFQVGPIRALHVQLDRDAYLYDHVGADDGGEHANSDDEAQRGRATKQGVQVVGVPVSRLHI